jgi:hypothetical protein
LPVFTAESQKVHFYTKFFGPRYENLRRIADKNLIICNYQPGCEVGNTTIFALIKVIKIWGEEKNANRAYQDFKCFAEAIVGEAEISPKKSRAWSRPDRELTEKQIKRKERAERKLAELRRYQGVPDPSAKIPYVVTIYIKRNLTAGNF